MPTPRSPARVRLLLPPPPVLLSMKMPPCRRHHRLHTLLLLDHALLLLCAWMPVELCHTPSASTAVLPIAVRALRLHEAYTYLAFHATPPAHSATRALRVRAAALKARDSDQAVINAQ